MRNIRAGLPCLSHCVSKAMRVAFGKHGEHAQRPEPTRPSARATRARRVAPSRARCCAARDRPRPTSLPTARPQSRGRRAGARTFRTAARPAEPHSAPARRRSAADRRGGPPIPPPSAQARRPSCPPGSTCAASAWSSGSAGAGRAIERFERLAPPGEAKAGDHRIATRGEDRAESDVKTPERLHRRPCPRRHISEREAPVRVEIVTYQVSPSRCGRWTARDGRPPPHIRSVTRA